MTIPVTLISPQTCFIDSCLNAFERSELQLRCRVFQQRFDLSALSEERPRLVIFDAATDWMSPLVLLDRLKKLQPDARMICYLHQLSGGRAQSLLNLNVRGLCDRRISATDLVAGMKRVLRGETFLSPRVAQSLALGQLRRDDPFYALSARELTVCDLVTSGIKAPEIASTLDVSPKTINTYRYRIFEKLGIDSDVQLTHLAYRHGRKALESEHERI